MNVRVPHHGKFLEDSKTTKLQSQKFKLTKHTLLKRKYSCLLIPLSRSVTENGSVFEMDVTDQVERVETWVGGN